MKHVKSKKGSELLGQILLWALLISALLVFSVPFFFMSVIGTELSVDFHILSHIILCNVYQSFRYHHRDPVLRVT